jgi:hypothetical protein
MLYYFRWSLEICFYVATVAVGNQGFLTKEITFLKEKGKKIKTTTISWYILNHCVKKLFQFNNLNY